MPTVFLSYSREDLPLIEQLESRLLTPPSDIAIWRDQEKIYGGQKWPKVLGQAIADQDVFLLAWSKNSAASDRVGFEWHTALAQGKTIVPYLLDNTPLPPVLKELPLYQAADPEGIVKALCSTTRAGSAVKQAAAVSIEQPRPAKPNTASAEADNPAPAVPPHSESQKTQKPLIERWQSWAAFAASVATVATAMVAIAPELSQKLGLTLFTDEEQVLEQILAGSVQDAQTNRLLDRVDVILPEFGLTVTTNPSGYFEFHVRAPKQETVSVSATREGYAPSEIQKQILGDRKVVILLKRKKP